jgi:hypothetical protein
MIIRCISTGQFYRMARKEMRDLGNIWNLIFTTLTVLLKGEFLDFRGDRRPDYTS